MANVAGPCISAARQAERMGGGPRARRASARGGGLPCGAARAIGVVALVGLLLAASVGAAPDRAGAQAVGPSTAEIVTWACWGRTAPPCVPDTTQDGSYPLTVTSPTGQTTAIHITVAGGRGAYTLTVLTTGIHQICQVGRTPIAVRPASLVLVDERCVELPFGQAGGQVEFYNIRPLLMAGASVPMVRRVPGSTRKVCQVIGDVDQERAEVTVNQTATRIGLAGSDLGASVQHGAGIYYFFGDTNPSGDLSGDRPFGGDSIAFSDDPSPDDCIRLDFVRAPDALYRSPSLPGISLSSFEVPTGGFSAQGKLYVFFTTESSEARVMGRSFLASSANGGRDFTYLYDVSRDKFINVAPVVVDHTSVPGLPPLPATGGTGAGEAGVLLWGSGAYRESDPYLAWAPLAAIEQRSAWRYFAGVDPASGRPRWSEGEADAVPLFANPCIGELSAGWNPILEAWLLLYNCHEPRGIIYRVAGAPWGPWSDAALLFDPGVDGGYCHFIHTNWDAEMCDSVHDPGREREWGGEYGPYLINAYIGGGGGRAIIFFLMSTWNPYTVVLMQATLELTGVGPSRSPPSFVASE
jgi:hypothetical protein